MEEDTEATEDKQRNRQTRKTNQDAGSGQEEPPCFLAGRKQDGKALESNQHSQQNREEEEIPEDDIQQNNQTRHSQQSGLSGDSGLPRGTQEGI